MKKAVILLAALWLAGCAVTPKPTLSEKDHEVAAWDWYSVNKCGVSGKISLEAAAAGRETVSASLAQYQYDKSRFGTLVQQLEQRNPEVTQERCNALAIQSLQFRQRQQASSSRSGGGSGPSFTTCNRTFNQVFCTSY